MEQLELFTENQEQRKDLLVNLKEASKWASEYLNRNVTNSNISYLIQYGKINKYYLGTSIAISLTELKNYYDNSNFTKEDVWKEKLGLDLNWHLSFSECKEAETTKHVHRLHPYKGKYIPQLVEYFLDSHTDEFKQEPYFSKDEIVLDPFCGSGTTLVQANELSLHAVGIDISSFNTMISNIKIKKHDLLLLKQAASKITSSLIEFQRSKTYLNFEEELALELSMFNSKFFPSPEFKKMVRIGEIKEKEYAQEKEKEFLTTYEFLLDKYQIKLTQEKNSNFLDIWFLSTVREEINFLFKEINELEDLSLKELLIVILSRTIRSCRATTHADLATLKEPVTTTYYCKKHGKICRPIFSILQWWQRYTQDTLTRLQQFSLLRTETFQACLVGDSQTIDIYQEIKKINSDFAKLILEQKIQGIFSSPPYVGLIDYHEQHAYAYDLFEFKRQDNLEIGAMFKGQGKEARNDYVKAIAAVLQNCKKYLQDNYNVFLVANDKYNLYPEIARQANMQIVNQFKRPVLNRVEKDRGAYCETIFQLQENRRIL